jgi:hypothetical protein
MPSHCHRHCALKTFLKPEPSNPFVDLRVDCSAASRSRSPNRQSDFKMKTQRRPEKILTTTSLVGLALGFSALGLLIVAKSHGDGASLAGGILGILLGGAFMIAACLHWKRGDGIPGNLRVDEVPSAEIVSEIRRAANAIYGF